MSREALPTATGAPVLIRALDGRQPRPRPVRRAGARAAVAPRTRRAARRGRRLGREPARQRPGAHRRDPAERDRLVQGVQAGVRRRTAWSCRWPRSTSSPTRRSRTAPSPPTTRRARLRRAEDDGAPWTSAPSWARRSSCCGAGAKGTETDACRRPDVAIERLREAINYLCEYAIDAGLWLPVRARSQAQRAARRHLHAHDRRLPRVHPHARASGHGGREPRGGARAHGGPQLHPRRRARRGTPASCSTSI